MIDETIGLLRLWERGDSPSRLSEKAIQSGLFSRTTARRARNIVEEMFAPRYLVQQGQPAAALKSLVERNLPGDDLSQLFFLHTARAQAIFGDFVTEVYWPRYSAAAVCLTRAEAETFVYRALDTGRMQKRWTETTIRRVSGYLLGCCGDFGLTDSGGRGERVIRRFALRPRVALYLAHELHFSGATDQALTQHSDWRLFGLEPHEVVLQLKSLAHDGHLIIQAAANLVQIAWKYPTMEDCVRAIAQR